MEQETIIELLSNSTHVNFDNAERIRIHTIIRGMQGTVEYRGMLWLRGIFIPTVNGKCPQDRK